ncbi:hypothetical protein F5883DRAFT_657621 [Diaporthe sp. PMI_573]|nr:hypothetical protein F5883DRAFT_657621 [Diaporthaceae sp. PMI_573]
MMEVRIWDHPTMATLQQDEDYLLLGDGALALQLVQLRSGLLDLLPVLGDLLRLVLLALCPVHGLLGRLLFGSGEGVVAGVLGLLVLRLLLLLGSIESSTLLLGGLDALLDHGVDEELLVDVLDAHNVEGAGIVRALDAERLHVGLGGVDERLSGGEHLVNGELGRATRADHARARRRGGGLEKGVGLGHLARTHFEFVVMSLMRSCLNAQN